MVSEAKTRAKRAGEWLMKTMKAFLGQHDPSQVAGHAYMQACMAQASTQALVTLLRRKNICSEDEIDRYLADAYEAREQMFHEQSIIAAPAPQIITSSETN